MGIGSSVATSFTTVAATTSRPSRDDSGQVVHIVGTVGAADVALSSPFGGAQGAAIRITCSRQSTIGVSHGAFRAQSAVDFYVVTDSGTKIRVAVPDVEAWTWRLGTSHTAFNIMIDKTGTTLYSGGKMHEHSAIEARPDAMLFWERLNGGRDPVSMLQRIPVDRADGTAFTTVGPGHNAEDLNRPRMAVEQTLQLGDAVAVLGVLGVAENGELTISPQLRKGKGAITNEPSVAASLKDVRGGVAAAAPGEELRVVALGKHKKAKNYAGKNW